MPTVSTFDMTGKQSGTMELSAEVFIHSLNISNT